MKRLLVFLLVALASSLSAATLASDRGDPEAGRIKAYTCTGCHGIANYKNAYPSYRVPKIGGQNYEYLLIALRAYQSGDRSHPTMVAQAEGMTEADLLDIASFLSSLGE